jgi:hypothetical protein
MKQYGIKGNEKVKPPGGKKYPQVGKKKVHNDDA